jgi:hypothetical protein
MPTITVDDLCRAYENFGTPPEFVRGKMTKKKVGRAVIDQQNIITTDPVTIDRAYKIIIRAPHKHHTNTHTTFYVEV